MRKFISLILVLLMVLSMPIQVYAIGTPNASASTDYGDYSNYNGAGLWTYKPYDGHWPNGVRLSLYFQPAKENGTVDWGDGNAWIN